MTISGPTVGPYGACISTSKVGPTGVDADGLKRVVLFLGLLLCCVGCVVLWMFTGHAVVGPGMVSTPLQSSTSEASFMERQPWSGLKHWYTGPAPTPGTVRYLHWERCNQQGKKAPCWEGNDWASLQDCVNHCPGGNCWKRGYWGAFHCQMPVGQPCDFQDECQGGYQCVNKNRVFYNGRPADPDPKMHFVCMDASCCVSQDNDTDGPGECLCLDDPIVYPTR